MAQRHTHCPREQRIKNVAVIGEEAITQVSWDDAFSFGAMHCPRYSFSASGANLNQLPKEQIKMKTIKNFLKDESGMETLEYAVIAGLIATVAVLVYASGWGKTLLDRLNAATTAT
jgi:Flp pilus assembly pilin Flp